MVLNTNNGGFVKEKVLFIKLMILISFSFLIIYSSGYYYLHHNAMKKDLLTKTNIYIEGLTAPRGRIYDQKGKVLVDNQMINNLVFYNLKGIDKIKVAKKIASLFTFDKPNEKEIILWYKNTQNVTKMLSDHEKYEIKTRQKTFDELINDKLSMLFDSISDHDLNIIKVYALLNDGYEKSPKIIKEDLTDEEVNYVINSKIPGINIEVGFKRIYPYGNTLQSIFGKVGKITREEKNEYLKEGYNLNDVVGLSYLEKYYDHYLKGTKAKYLVNDDNSLTLLEKERKGNDLYLAIDIELQLKLEMIVENQLKRAKKYPNTQYLTDTFVIISNPQTGEINAIIGKRLLENGIFNDITISNITSSFTMGSVVKGATMSVALANKIFDPYKKIYDSCIKLKHMTPKCSWKKLGYLDAITALEQSSNYYQFLLAIKMLDKDYTYDMDLEVNENDFKVYRQMLASYGLGIKTGIDLPNEKIGLIGTKVSGDLYLNLAIGQYDTYTPVELITYINTLASKGSRHKPYLVEMIKDHQEIVWQNNHEIVDQTSISNEDYDLLFQGFYHVMNQPNATGYGFMNKSLHPAGKTGTSESFFDADHDGIIDTSTISLTMAGFFPYEEPRYSIIIISPNVSKADNQGSYAYPLTYFISREITDFMFENMENSWYNMED